MIKLDEFVDSLPDSDVSTDKYRKRRARYTVIRRVYKYLGGVYPPLDMVFNSVFLSHFQGYLVMDNLAMNTISFYMGVLRSLHGDAVEAGLLPPNPKLFADVFTGTVPTKKRAVGEEVIASMHAADLSGDARLQTCRDLFMLSLCLYGMPFIDLLHLRKCDLQGDTLVYVRIKTKKPVCVHISAEAIEYIDRLTKDGKSTIYLLPILKTTERLEYENALRLQNDRLKDLAKQLKISERLTTHVARHTWASMAHNNGEGIAVISRALGHQSEKMTEVYIDSFVKDALQTAGQTVINAMMKPIREGVVTNVREEVRRKIEEEQPQQQPETEPKKRKTPITKCSGMDTPDKPKTVIPKDQEEPDQAELQRRGKDKKKRLE
jgi:integrase